MSTGDRYVQYELTPAQIAAGRFAGDLSLNSYDSYYSVPEPVEVYLAAGDAAAALRAIIGEPERRPGMPAGTWYGLTPRPTLLGGVTVFRRPPGECGG